MTASSTPAPVDPAASADVRALFTYLYDLPNRAEHRLVTGQQLGEARLEVPSGGSSGAQGYWSDGLEDLLTIRNTTGREVGLVGVDYLAGGAGQPGLTLSDISRFDLVNPVLKAYAARGGIVTAMAHLPNPNNTGAEVTTGLRDRIPNFADITMPGTAAHANYRVLLDRLALALADLQGAGIPVLWRPFHEMDKPYFWWGAQHQATFQLAWRQQYDYLTNVKGLHNLLWVYSTIDADQLGWYPGDDYVDVIGQDWYVWNALRANQARSRGKIAAVTEIGAPSANYDCTHFLNGLIHPDQRNLSYWMAWCGDWAPVAHLNWPGLYTHSVMANLSEVVEARAALQPLLGWRLANFGTIHDAGEAAAQADPDHDGVANLLEYALGGHPGSPDAPSILPVVSVEAGHPRLTFTCLSARTDLIYTVQSSGDSVAWSDIARSSGGGLTTAINASGALIDDPGGATRRVGVSHPTGLAPGQPRFLRLRISAP